MAISNIEEFKSQLHTGGARPTMFYISCVFPTAAGQAGVRPLTYMAKSGSIPEEIISPINVGYFGRKIKLAGDRTYNNWSTSVINSEDFIVRQSFEDWHFNLNDIEENVRFPQFVTPNEYKREVDIVQLSQNGKPIIQYTLFGAFPVRLGEIKLSWDEQNTIEDFDVTFAYDYFRKKPLSDRPAPASSSGISRN